MHGKKLCGEPVSGCWLTSGGHGVSVDTRKLLGAVSLSGEALEWLVIMLVVSSSMGGCAKLARKVDEKLGFTDRK